MEVDLHGFALLRLIQLDLHGLQGILVQTLESSTCIWGLDF